MPLLSTPLSTFDAREGGGDLKIESKPGERVRLPADFVYSHPDRKPLGDIAGTMNFLGITHPEIDFVCNHSKVEEEVDETETGRLGQDKSENEGNYPSKGRGGKG